MALASSLHPPCARCNRSLFLAFIAPRIGTLSTPPFALYVPPAQISRKGDPRASRRFGGEMTAVRPPPLPPLLLLHPRLRWRSLWLRKSNVSLRHVSPVRCFLSLAGAFLRFFPMLRYYNARHEKTRIFIPLGASSFSDILMYVLQVLL